MELLDTVTLVGTLVLALPIAMLGVEFAFVDGRLLTGIGFLAVAAALVVGQHYLGLKERIAGSAADRFLEADTVTTVDSEKTANADDDALQTDEKR